MLDRSKKRPRDPNQLAHQLMVEFTGQAPKFTPSEEKPVTPSKNPHDVAQGSSRRPEGWHYRSRGSDNDPCPSWILVKRLAAALLLLPVSIAWPQIKTGTVIYADLAKDEFTVAADSRMIFSAGGHDDTECKI